MSNHYFLAVPISKEVKEYLNDFCENIKDQMHFKRWVHPMDYHITLVFLGAVDETKISEIMNGLGDVVKNNNQFSLKLSGASFFGNLHFPRIFWAGVSNNPKLLELQKNVYHYCESIGFTLEKRSYNPHITLARKWALQEKMTVETKDFLNDIEVEWNVKNIVLYKTHLDKNPKYEEIHVFDLAK